MISNFRETWLYVIDKNHFFKLLFLLFYIFLYFLRPCLAKPIFFFRKTAKKQTQGCVCQTPLLARNSFIKKNNKPNKALNILPDFDLSGLTLKQTKNKNSKPK